MAFGIVFEISVRHFPHFGVGVVVMIGLRGIVIERIVSTAVYAAQIDAVDPLKIEIVKRCGRIGCGIVGIPDAARIASGKTEMTLEDGRHIDPMKFRLYCDPPHRTDITLLEQDCRTGAGTLISIVVLIVLVQSLIVVMVGHQIEFVVVSAPIYINIGYIIGFCGG